MRRTVQKASGHHFTVTVVLNSIKESEQPRNKLAKKNPKKTQSHK